MCSAVLSHCSKSAEILKIFIVDDKFSSGLKKFERVRHCYGFLILPYSKSTLPYNCSKVEIKSYLLITHHMMVSR